MKPWLQGWWFSISFMRILTQVTLLLIAFLVNGCDWEDKSVNEKVKKEEEELIVKFGFKSSKEDEFKIILKDVIAQNSQKKSIFIKQYVTESTQYSSIVANFGSNMSTDLSIDLGSKRMKEIRLNGIEVSFGENSVLVTPDNFNKYFKCNKYVEFNVQTGILKTKDVDGKHFPFVIARKKLFNGLKDITE